MKKILLLLCLVSLSFSSLLWETSTDGAITTKPVYFQNSVVVGSDDGNVYALEPSTGSVSWNYAMEKDILDFTVFDGDLVAANTKGKIAKLESGGSEHWTLDLSAQEYNVTYVYAIDSNSNSLFAATSSGIYKISKSGEPSLLYGAESPTALAAGSDYVIFVSGRNITRIDDKGSRQWERRLEDGNFWDSSPTIDESTNSVYVGALDDRLHAFHLTGGYEKWNYLTRGWILSTPLVADSTIFFGSTDGNVYAIGISGGNTRWKTALPLAMVSEPEKGVMGGTSVIFAGGTDRAAYALDTESGSVVWKGSVSGRVGSPLYYQDKVIFGSTDGIVYAYSTERSCSIDSPTEGSYIGTKELVVSGRSVSETGSQQVEINLNEGGWEPTTTAQDGTWEAVIGPDRLSEGINSISCRVTDASGTESGTSFTTVLIIKDSSLLPDNFIITTSPDNPVEGEQFTVYVNSKEDGSPVDRFELAVNGKTYEGDKAVNVTMDDPGTYTIVVEKTGFNQGRKTVNIAYEIIDPLYVVVGAVILLIVIWTVYTRFIRKRSAEE